MQEMRFVAVLQIFDPSGLIRQEVEYVGDNSQIIAQLAEELACTPSEPEVMLISIKEVVREGVLSETKHSQYIAKAAKQRAEVLTSFLDEDDEDCNTGNVKWS